MLHQFKGKIIFNFVIFVATKKATNNSSSPLSFVAVFGSGIRDPAWIKIRIRNKKSRIGNTAIYAFLNVESLQNNNRQVQKKIETNVCQASADWNRNVRFRIQFELADKAPSENMI